MTDADLIKELKRLRTYMIGDHLNHIMSAAIAALEAKQWQPIEAAPRDREILVRAYRNNSDVLETVCVKWYDAAEAWFIYGCGTTHYSPQWLDQCIPVNWQPLPTEDE
jgi:hypothetical protein